MGEPEPDHEPGVLADDEEPLDWDLDERDQWMADHIGLDEDLAEEVLVESDE